jgi:hypothetical protein
MEGLLRGDSLGRARFYQIMTLIGAMTRNEVRAKENLPPIDGGDVITIQSQNVPLEQLIQQSVEDGLQKRCRSISRGSGETEGRRVRCGSVRSAR